MLRSLIRVFASCSLLLLSLSCSSPPTAMEEAAGKPDHFWIGDQVSGSPRMIISLSQQRVYYFKGDKLVGASPISSGREYGWTKSGSFKIIQKDLNHRSTLYGSFVTPDGTVIDDDVDSRKDKAPPGTRFLGADMKYFMRITGAIGMHRGYLPGYPASHGCIRLPGHMAEIFYHATPLGTPIEIRQGPVHVQEPEVRELAQKKEPKPAAKPAAAPKPSRRELREQRGEWRRAPRPRGYGRGYPKPPVMAPGTTLYLY